MYPHSTTSRNTSLDLLKAASILMVVFFHNGQLHAGSFLDNLFMLLPMAAVPCFFMASGAVFFHRPFDLKRHIRRTLLFYLTVVLWKGIYFVLYTSWGAPWDGSLRALFSYLFLFQSMDGISTAHMWFMDAMLTTMLAAPFLHLLFQQKGDSRLLPGHHDLLVVLLTLLVLFNQITGSGNLIISLVCDWIGKPAWDIAPLAEVNPFSFRYSNYFTYYILGGLLLEYRNTIKKQWSVIFSVLGLLGLLMIQKLQTGSFLWQGTLISGGYYWISTLLLACGIFLVFTSLSMGEHPILSSISIWFGKNTLWIFYLHIPLIYLLTPTLFQPLSSYNGWLLNLLESILICLLSLVIRWIYKTLTFHRL